jgi:hypothetical protein
MKNEKRRGRKTKENESGRAPAFGGEMKKDK